MVGSQIDHSCVRTLPTDTDWSGSGSGCAAVCSMLTDPDQTSEQELKSR